MSFYSFQNHMSVEESVKPVCLVCICLDEISGKLTGSQLRTSLKSPFGKCLMLIQSFA